MPKILVIDDDRTVLHMVQRALAEIAEPVLAASSADEGMELLREHQPDTVLLDIMLPDTSGLALFQQIREIDRRLPIIFITAGAGSESAIEAIQLGAFDYVAKPLDLPKLKSLVEKALETRRLMSVPVALGADTVDNSTGELFVGRSPRMLDVFKAVGRVAKQSVAVLVRGESGTGKELVARALYQHSDRNDQPFMAINCAALPDTLLESELFGHEKGAFTGADRRRIGKFEQCNGGVLFLDEIGDMSPLVQSKVLRLLQEQRFERVGGGETICTDVRLIAATNQDLEKMVEEGDFRADLFYRLNGVTVHLPPLRDRGEDVALLLQYFLGRARQELKRPEMEGFSSEALDILKHYAWPGNVRELASVMRQAVLKASGPVIVPEFLPAEVRGPVAAGGGDSDASPASTNGFDIRGYIEQRLRADTSNLYAEAVEAMERFLFTRVLQETDGNQTRAAEILGITRGKVRDRIASFNISVGKSVTIEAEAD
ncbi:MAG: sigma-54-dependent Fis family transcriptional regulator [Planctomycetales bacterium]|nr:sigma-54-dependent Fis family transcriptional regulator [Planctomycetales bacterium]